MDKIINIDLTAVLKAQNFTTKDQTRYALTYILIEGAHYIATDGIRLMAYMHNQVEKLPCRLVIRFTKANIVAVKKMKRDKIMQFAAPFNLATQVLGVGKNRIICDYEIEPSYAFTYPNWRQAIPKASEIQAHQVMHVNVSLLAAFGEPVSIYATAENGPLVVYPQTSQQWVGMVMPMRGDIRSDHAILTELKAETVPAGSPKRKRPHTKI